MDVMFWVWLGVIIVTAIIEFVTLEMVSIWFTAGAIIPFIMAATNAVRWEVQLVTFIVLSAILVASLRGVTKRYLLRNSNEKTNVDALIGQKVRMLSRTDFETMGSVKIGDVIWSAIGENQQTIQKDEIVEIIKVEGNKLVVMTVEEQTENPIAVDEGVQTTAKKAEENASGAQLGKKSAPKTVKSANSTAKTTQTARKTAAKKPQAAKASGQNSTAKAKPKKVETKTNKTNQSKK